MTTPSTQPQSHIGEDLDRSRAVEKHVEMGSPLLSYLLAGVALGIVFTKSEIISWFRIQEMFRFGSFHMYGIIGTAVAVAAASVYAIEKFQVKTFGGNLIRIPPKEIGRWGSRYWIGGTFFGIGWALLGACPGPIFALIGSGVTVVVVAMVSGVIGTWFYGLIRGSLPHG